ncbi:malate/lactate dehydrogenase-like protein [Mesobacillus foraminis]|uniref:Malate/lactate dehydrogenase-like protein n=2 Tax=Mesobacillus foraminis TaxID=279826 RepID=A0A4R2B390_9BACI|nr:malate/lactate dehydrogenase-like protein [Mesobacillus foraminis]
MIPSMYDTTQKQSISHLMIAIDISSFMEVGTFRRLSSTLAEYVKQAERASGVEELYLPGEIEFGVEASRMENGIPVSEGVLDDLNRLAASLGIHPLSA